MGKVIDEIGPNEAKFIQAQKVFFVATAPLSSDHHVSVSPKAAGIVVLGPHEVMYADLTGSGAETAAHVLQNGRMTLMFCNLEAGPPKILRLFGTATVIAADSAPKELLDKLPTEIAQSFGFRALYKLAVSRISSSCGYALPVMEFQKNRTILSEFTAKQGKDGMFEYLTHKNSFSIDGLPTVALLRQDAPDTVAVKEDGYYRGKVPNGAIDKATKRMLGSVDLKSRHWSNAGIALTALAVGFVIGRCAPAKS